MVHDTHDTGAKVTAPAGEADAETGPPQDVLDTHTARIPPGARPRDDREIRVVSSVAIAECPLHTAMREVAEAALTQHVLYAEGVYQPREGLGQEMQVWLHLHELVRTSMCPATRAQTSALEPGDLEIAVAGLPMEMRAKVATAIRACGRRSQGEGCPLETEPVGSLIGENSVPRHQLPPARRPRGG